MTPRPTLATQRPYSHSEPKSVANWFAMTRRRNSSCFSWEGSPERTWFSRETASGAAYSAFPELTLWRSRADGSDRMQLSYSMVGEDKGFSPDGKSVAFNPFGKLAMSSVSIEGGQV